MEIKTYLRYILPIFAVGCLLTSACKKNTADAIAVNKPVVEAYLVPGQTLTVKVYQQKALTDTATYGAALTGLSINVSDGAKTISLTESSAGVYTYPDLSFVTGGKTYSMKFAYSGVDVTASTVMPGQPVGFKITDSIYHIPATIDQAYASKVLQKITWTNPDSLYHILVLKNLDNDPFNAGQVRSNAKPNFEINTERGAEYDILQSSFNYYGHYLVILMRVNEDYIDMLTSNSNGTSQNLVNPPTNIVNGLGIFTAMQADTLKLRVTTQ